MENELITKILKNSPNLFNNNLPRLVDCVTSKTPGPGFYCTDKPSFKIEAFKHDFENNIQYSNPNKDSQYYSLNDT